MTRRGEIYMVNFGGGSGSRQAGLRPALVIQSDLGNEYASTTIVAAMSTAPGPAYPVRVTVSPGESGLRETSTVKLDQIVTVDQRALGRRVGRLAPAVMQEVDRALHYSLGLVD